MNIQNLIKLWPQYQNWLKQNNITPNNIQQRIPEFVQQVRQNPEDSKRLDSYLSNPDLTKIAKSQLNLTDDQINKIKKVAGVNQTPVGSPTVTLRKTGYYLVNFSGVLSAASTGLVSTQLYNNGVAIPGALSSITIDTAGSLKNVSFSTVVRVLNSCACIDNTANLTVVNTGLEATYSDAEITIVRLN